MYAVGNSSYMHDEDSDMKYVKVSPEDWHCELEGQIPGYWKKQDVMFRPSSHVAHDALKLRQLQKGRGTCAGGDDDDHHGNEWRKAGAQSNNRCAAASAALVHHAQTDFSLVKDAWCGVVMKRVVRTENKAPSPSDLPKISQGGRVTMRWPPA